MKLLLSVGPSYRKKLGEQDVLVIVGLLLAPPIILLGEQLLSLLLRFRLLWLLVPNGPFTLWSAGWTSAPVNAYKHGELSSLSVVLIVLDNRSPFKLPLTDTSQFLRGLRIEAALSREKNIGSRHVAITGGASLVWRL